MIPRQRRPLRPRVDRLDDRWLPASISGLTPGLLAQAYGFNPAVFNGAGQKIAIIDAYHDPYLASDLVAFDRAMGLPGTTTAQVAGFLTQINQAGGVTNDGWAGESSLDVEWAHAAAPQAQIVVVEARSDNLQDLMAAVNTARSIPGVSVVSMSWGAGEFSSQTAYDSYFTTPANHVPITFLAASGDTGAAGGAEWPASSPNVIAVGGTSLHLAPSGGISYETGWSGSGGGVSAVEWEPSYQARVQGIGRRTTPDLAVVGDPYTGVATYTTSPSSGQGAWLQVGGTSASAQIWAGFIADANHARAYFGMTSLDTASALSVLYRSPFAFHDVVAGSNGYPATVGYDLVTGMGTPVINAVFWSLLGATPTTTTASAAVVTKATVTAAPQAVNATAASVVTVGLTAAPVTISPAQVLGSAAPPAAAAPAPSARASASSSSAAAVPAVGVLQGVGGGPTYPKRPARPARPRITEIPALETPPDGPHVPSATDIPPPPPVPAAPDIPPPPPAPPLPEEGGDRPGVVGPRNGDAGRLDRLDAVLAGWDPAPPPAVDRPACEEPEAEPGPAGPAALASLVGVALPTLLAGRRRRRSDPRLDIAGGPDGPPPGRGPDRNPLRLGR